MGYRSPLASTRKFVDYPMTRSDSEQCPLCHSGDVLIVTQVSHLREGCHSTAGMGFLWYSNARLSTRPDGSSVALGQWIRSRSDTTEVRRYLNHRFELRLTYTHGIFDSVSKSLMPRTQQSISPSVHSRRCLGVELVHRYCLKKSLSPNNPGLLWTKSSGIDCNLAKVCHLGRLR